METPTISIVMSTYNAERDIKETIESILNQTFSDFELIIVNDGTDKTTEIIADYSDSRLVIIDNKHDFIGSLNLGISKSKGLYIVRMGPNDIMVPNRLELQYVYMENNPTIDICGGFMETVGLNSRLIKPPTNHEDIILELLFANWISNPTTILRKTSLSKLSYYPSIYRQEYIYAEDYGLWTELAIADFKFANIPEVLVKYRTSERQVTSTHNEMMFKTSIIIQKEYLEFIGDSLSEDNEVLFDFLDKAVDLINEQALKFNTFKLLIYDIYRKKLIESRERDKTKLLFCLSSCAHNSRNEFIIDILKKIDYQKFCIDLLVFESSQLNYLSIPSQVHCITIDDSLLVNYDLEVAFFESSTVKYIASRKTEGKKIAILHSDLQNSHWTKSFLTNNMAEDTSLSAMDKIILISDDIKDELLNLLTDVYTSRIQK